MWGAPSPGSSRRSAAGASSENLTLSSRLRAPKGLELTCGQIGWLCLVAAGVFGRGPSRRVEAHFRTRFLRELTGCSADADPAAGGVGALSRRALA